MRASSTTLLVALATTGCSVYEEMAPTSGGTAGVSGLGGGSGTGGPGGGSSGSGGNAKDGSSGAGSADAGSTDGASGTSGTGGSSGVDGAAGRGGSAGTAGAGGAAGAGGSSGTAGTADGGSAGASGSSGTGGTSTTDGSTVDAPPGIDTFDGAQPCVTGTGPTSLPFAVDQYFVASGWMQAPLIRQDATCTYPVTADGGRDGSSDADAATDVPNDRGTAAPLPGSKCWTVTYTPTASTDWAGVDWQFPTNNWGSSPGLVIPPGAARVSVVAWGETGNERVTFQAGYGATSTDRFGASLADQTLTTSPTTYGVDLSGIAYTCNSVRMGFGWTAAGGAAMTFHIADIRWE